MPTTQSIKFHPPKSNINVGCVGTKFAIPYVNTSTRCCIGNIDICREKNVIQGKLVHVTKKSSKAFVDSLDHIQATNL